MDRWFREAFSHVVVDVGYRPWERTDGSFMFEVMSTLECSKPHICQETDHEPYELHGITTLEKLKIAIFQERKDDTT